MKNKLDILKYLNLYLGSEFYFLTNGIKYHGIVESVMEHGCYGNDIDATMWLNEIAEEDDFKLILTDTRDMTITQKNKYYSLTKKVKNTIVDTPESLIYCFSIGIDMFELIERGLAVNKKCVIYKKIIEKDYKNEDEELTIVEIKESNNIITNHLQYNRSDACGELYELIISQNVIPFKEEESPFEYTPNSMWHNKYLNFSYDEIDWSIRKDTRIKMDSDKYKIGETVYLICEGVSRIRLWAIKDLINEIKEKISGAHEAITVKDITEEYKTTDEHPNKKKRSIVRRTKYVPDPNWQPPEPPKKFILNH